MKPFFHKYGLAKLNNLYGQGSGTGDETDGVNAIVSTGNSLNSAGSGYILTSVSTSAYLEYSAEL